MHGVHKGDAGGPYVESPGRGDYTHGQHMKKKEDYPGHGKSSLIAEIHTMEIMAESVKEVLDFLKIDSCVMIGHSMGGYVTLAFADQNPGLLKGFGLFHSSAAADTDEGTKNRERAIFW